MYTVLCLTHVSNRSLYPFLKTGIGVLWFGEDYKRITGMLQITSDLVGI